MVPGYPPQGYPPQGYPPQQPYPRPHQQPYRPPQPAPQPPPSAAASKEKTLKTVGLVLWALGCGLGLLVQLWVFLIEPLMKKNGGSIILAELIALCFALPACLVYMWVPVLIDRFEPEPWWALLMAFLWGALAAAGISIVINTVMGSIGGAVAGNLGHAVMGAVISAPIVEEATKAAAVLGVFWFFRREFDGIVDGVIYATFSALGFAMTENVLYYARGLLSSADGSFIFQLALRGILKPWGHPLYTALTGIGIGLARESTKTSVKWLAPIGFYALGVAMHSAWNFSGVLSSILRVDLIYIMLPLYFFGALLPFLGIVTWLVLREGRTLRKNLHDEMLMGNLTAQELDIICSPFGRIKARFGRRGAKGAEFVKAAIHLGMAKWHTARAVQGRKATISVDSILPLRQDMLRLKREMGGTL